MTMTAYEPLTEEQLMTAMQKASLRGKWTAMTVALLVRDVAFWRNHALNLMEEKEAKEKPSSKLILPEGTSDSTDIQAG